MSGTPADTLLGNEGVAPVYRRVSNSSSLRVAVFGVILVVLGATVITGSEAAMLAIWGGALTVTGVVAYALVWYGRYR